MRRPKIRTIFTTAGKAVVFRVFMPQAYALHGGMTRQYGIAARRRDDEWSGGGCVPDTNGCTPRRRRTAQPSAAHRWTY